jgi:predicted DsbA family dithiol-disulfide isomerase|eukprot:COSAG02_NODE_868_length_16360_cov_12.608204_4_plen_215_part_00
MEAMEREGLMFGVEFSRRPFFLRPNWNVEEWLETLDLPVDATKADVAKKTGRDSGSIRKLFRECGLHPDWDRVSGPGSGYSDTLDSHRLAWYAATVGKGEEVWNELSRRYFEGKPAPMVLGSRKQLLEVARVSGLDVSETKRVLESGQFTEEVKADDRQMRLQGIEGIPVMHFDVVGTGRDDPLRGALPHVRTDGSRSSAEFRAVFEQLHQATV